MTQGEQVIEVMKADDTYDLSELLHIYNSLTKQFKEGPASVKMGQAADKLEDIICAMVNDMTYD